MLSILYVDDSQAQLDDMREALASSLYTLSTATTLQEAKERMAQCNPELVIIDYHMPRLTGDECLRALRPLALENTRFYLYTTDANAFRQHREMGFDGVLMLKGKKPVKAQIDAVARYMTHYRIG
jgi:two-component system NtrC family sensor kinase